MPHMRRHRTVYALVGCAALMVATGCTREAEPLICPDLVPGDLVVTEIRGAQSGGNDTYGQWFEVFNASGGPVDLRGVQLRVFRLDGSGEEFLIIRAPELVADAGAYVVMGHHDPMRLPTFVDYSFFSDYFGEGADGEPQPKDLYDGGVVEALACGELVDRVVYRTLPTAGTWAYDGALDPDAEGNDDETAWCNDAEEPPPDGPQLYIGIPGTPGEVNRPCM